MDAASPSSGRGAAVLEVALPRSGGAAIDAAGMNVRINAVTLEDKNQAQRYVEEWKNIQAQAMLRVDQVLTEVEKRATLA